MDKILAAKIFFPKPNPGFSKKLLKLDRHTLSTCLQWLTGHTFLNRHEFVVGNLDFNECRFCMLEEETSSHLVTNCEVFWQERLSCFKACFDQDAPEWDVEGLVGFLGTKAIVKANSLILPEN